jgi:phosphatidyl-myo-inositol dimannoside synthase
MSDAASTLYYATEARLAIGEDGGFYSPDRRDSYDWLASRWLGAFDRLVLVARARAVEDLPRFRVDGPGIEVASVPNYQGSRQLIGGYLRARRAVRASCRDSSAIYAGRLPGVIGGLVLARARRLGAATIAHVCGDPRDVLASGIAGRVGVVLAGVAAQRMRRTVVLATAVIYVSMHQLQRRFPASPRRLSVGIPDVDLSDWICDAPHSRSSGGTPSVVAVGSQEQLYKGHDLLIEAVAADERHGFTVTLIGGGARHADLIAMARDRGVEDRVRFVGHVSTANELRALLDESDLFAMPSRTEGLPGALVEAMARGLPAVASDVGAISELLDPGALFEPDSLSALRASLQRALSDDGWRAAEAERNLSTARRLRGLADPGRMTAFLEQVRESRA